MTQESEKPQPSEQAQPAEQAQPVPADAWVPPVPPSGAGAGQRAQAADAPGVQPEPSQPESTQPEWGRPESTQPEWGQPEPTQQFAAVTTTPGTPQDGVRRSLPVWVWPAVAALSLVVGLLGGVLGAELRDQWDGGGLGLERSGTRTAPPLEEGNTSVAAVAGELLPSTVQVLASSDKSSGTGSGFVLDRSGHVVTNNHVVAAAATSKGEIQVVDHRGRTFEATVVGRSQVYDLAVLDIGKVEDLEPASLGSSDDLLVGEPVVAFGAPLGLSQTVTSGIVSALNRPVTTGATSDESSFINAVQTDAAINPGNSGGPLVGLDGRVVGVNSAIATTSGFLSEGGNIGVGFAIPIEQVEVTADQILRTGEARYPVIGATVRTSDNETRQGARIEKVGAGTPSARAGLEAGDVVTAINGTRVLDGISLIVQIRTHQPGEKVELTVRRGDKERTMTLTLDSEVG